LNKEIAENTKRQNKAENGFEQEVTKEAKGEEDLYRGKPQRAIASSFG
jgi:hypothetical protein